MACKAHSLCFSKLFVPSFKGLQHPLYRRSVHGKCPTHVFEWKKEKCLREYYQRVENVSPEIFVGVKSLDAVIYQCIQFWWDCWPQTAQSAAFCSMSAQKPHTFASCLPDQALDPSLTQWKTGLDNLQVFQPTFRILRSEKLACLNKIILKDHLTSSPCFLPFPESFCSKGDIYQWRWYNIYLTEHCTTWSALWAEVLLISSVSLHGSPKA